MWIRDSVRRRMMKDPVRGTAVVVAANMSDRYKNPQVLKTKLVVEAEGVPKTTVTHSQLIWGEWHFVWPDPGDAVPVVVDRADPTRLRFDRERFYKQRKRQRKATEAKREQDLEAEAYGKRGQSS